MTNNDLTSGTTLKADIDKITAIQAKIATANVTPHVYFVLAGEQYVSAGELEAAIGTSAYQTITAAAKTSLGTQLTSAKAAKQTTFDAL